MFHMAHSTVMQKYKEDTLINYKKTVAFINV